MNMSELLAFRPRRRGLSGAQKAALGGAIALLAAPAINIDKSLKDTYPASDPPASHYFDIPANRQ